MATCRGVGLGTIVGENRARVDPPAGPTARMRAMPPQRERSMPDQSPPVRFEHSNSYNIFILVLTVMSLIIMALLILPLPDAVHQVLNVYDNVICIVFL